MEALEGKLVNKNLLTAECVMFLSVRNGYGLAGSLWDMPMATALTLIELDKNCD